MDVKVQFWFEGDVARHDMKGSHEEEDRLLLGHRCDHFDKVGCSSERRAGKSDAGQRERGSRGIWARPARGALIPGQVVVDLPGDVALENAHDLSFRFALRGATSHVGLIRRVA
jgi:hypothetical protein